MQAILVTLSCVVLNSVAQIFLKIGINSLNKKLILSPALIPFIITNIYIIFGAILYGISFVLWLYVLSKVKVSYAYPFISLSYVIVAVLGFLILGEKISFSAWIGICLVVIGVTLISTSIGGS